MEDEARWIIAIKRLNVLPNIVTLFIFCIVTIKGRLWWSNEEILYSLISLISLIGYVISYFIKFEEFRSKLNLWAWMIGLITTIIWLIFFFNISFIIFKEIAVFAFIYGLLLIGYPLIMLYYNFRLFMNEISKPYGGLGNPSYRKLC
jgi:hypothetical protein